MRRGPRSCRGYTGYVHLARPRTLAEIGSLADTRGSIETGPGLTRPRFDVTEGVAIVVRRLDSDNLLHEAETWSRRK
jgi:hypothetical protein